jgi:hypothetical protein
MSPNRYPVNPVQESSIQPAKVSPTPIVSSSSWPMPLIPQEQKPVVLVFASNRKRLANHDIDSMKDDSVSLKLSYSRTYEAPLPITSSWFTTHLFSILGACFAVSFMIFYTIRDARI